MKTLKKHYGSILIMSFPFVFIIGIVIFNYMVRVVE